jgi:hypothetical protein
MMPPIAVVMMTVVIVLVMASLAETGLVALPGTQLVPGLLIEAAMISRIISRPVAGVRPAVTRDQDVALPARRLPKSCRLT